jgi:8-amino-7-oxononanoate synthase
MDGDCPNLEELILVSNKHQCYLVVDEAHALVFWFNRRRIRSNVEFTRSRFCSNYDFRKGWDVMVLRF